MFGGDGNDRLLGGAGNDQIDGEDGDDIIEGGEGNNTIYTGAGRNRVTTGGGADQINLVDILTGTNLISAGAGNDTINATRSLTDNTIYAGAGDDYITGGNGVNLLFGGDGNDVITGRGGTGRIDAGEGDDGIALGANSSDRTSGIQVFGGNGYDSLFIRSGEGRYVDLARSSIEKAMGGVGDDILDGSGHTVDLQLSGGDLGNDSLIGGSGNDRLEGRSGNDRLNGGDGNDILIGDAGNDRLDGGNGDDLLVGGEGNDSYYVREIDVRVQDTSGTDTFISSISFSLTRNDGLFTNIENIYLTSSDNLDATGNTLDNVLKGNEGNNTLRGLGGNDLLSGGGGDDILFGDEGSDRLLGGAGDDIYYVDSVSARLFETTTFTGGIDAGGIDLIMSSVSYSIADAINGRQFIENVILTGDDDINTTGNSLDNTLLGNDGDNAIRGGAGDDLIIGGEGRDILMGGSGSDTFQFADLDFGGNTVLTADVITDFGAGDVIDLHLVDAIPGTLANDRFVFIGSGAFNGVRGELRFEQFGGDTYVQGDTNGDGYSDFVIHLSGAHTLVAADFML